jgi:hypothetical protein
MTPKDDLLLSPDELPPRLRAWLDNASSAACVVSLEQLPDGRLLLRPAPDLDPQLVAHVRVTMAKYHEALMNLS